MNLLFIYGPPAAGKLTVANEIARLKDYKVFRNHELVGSVASVFSFEDDSLKFARNKLARKFRQEIFEEAAELGLNVITTYGGSGNDKFSFFKDVADIVRKKGGKVYFVQLVPNKEILLERVVSDSRRGIKIDTKEFLIKKFEDKNSYYDKYLEEEHITIDNSEMSAKETAKMIIDYYYL